MTSLTPEAYAVIEGRHPTRSAIRPARRERPHPWSVFSFPMRRGIHDAGLFEGRLRNGSQHYRLRARYGERQVEIEDPYRFPPVLSDFDLYLLGEGTHMNLYDKLGAHPMVLDGVEGVGFAVFAAFGQAGQRVKPVRFPPGRCRLTTSPKSTGSPTLAATIGMVEVACLAARAPGAL